ncbi:MAG: hypothetical protein ACUVQ0_01820 [Thermoproteota archaeon]
MKLWRVSFKQAGSGVNPNSFRLVNNLLEAGFTVGRFVKLRSQKGITLKPGDFVVKIEDDYSDHLMQDLGDEYCVDLKPLKSDDLQGVEWLSQTLIGVYSGRGASLPQVQETLEDMVNLGFRRISLLTGGFTWDDLSRLDALIVGDGDSIEILRSMGLEGARLLKRFIDAGGVYIGIGAGVILPLKPVNVLGAGYAELEAWSELQTIECELLSNMASEPSWPVFSSSRLDGGLRTRPVNGVVKSRIVKNSLLTLGYGGDLPMRYKGPVVKILYSRHVLGKIVSISGRAEYGLPYEKVCEILEGASSIVLAEQGEGRIVLFLPNIESPETPWTHSLLGNALLIKKYGSKGQIAAPRIQEEVSEGLKDASESYRVLRLIWDSLLKTVDQINNIVPMLYAQGFSDKASQLYVIGEAMKTMISLRNFMLDSIKEFVEMERIYGELNKKFPRLPQTMIIFNSLLEWRYVANKSRRALTPILERIMSIQEQIADLSASVISSPEDVERKFQILLGNILGGRIPLDMGFQNSPGAIPPLLSIVLNFKDSLEEMRFLRKVVSYVKTA